MSYLKIWRNACNRAGIQKSDSVPPDAVRAACKRGLSLADEFGGPGLTDGAKSRARSMAAGQSVSDETIGRMVNFFSRHQSNRADPSAKEPTPGAVAWLIWGGDAGKAWANSQYQKQDDGSISKSEGSRGGKVIGHTRTGKPIYAHDHASYARVHDKSPGGSISDSPARSHTVARSAHPSYSNEDHRDAARAHEKHFTESGMRGATASSMIRVAAAHRRAAMKG